MKATSFRRQVIVAFLVVFALVGGVMRYFAPNPSLMRDMGNLLLVLWVPAIGNVIAFLVTKARKPQVVPPGFPPDLPFAAHLRVQLTPFAPQVRRALGTLHPEQDQCTVVIGADGFTARLSQPLAAWLGQRGATEMELQFLRPDLALARFTPGTGFRLLAGPTVAAEGLVVRVLA